MIENFERHIIATQDGSKLEVFHLPGKTTVMLHYGLLCSFQHWSFLIPALEEHGYGVIAYHYRGHYNSTNEGEFNFTQFRDDAIEILDALEVSSDQVTHIGHSMGCAIALSLTASSPSMGAILLAGAFYPVNEMMMNYSYWAPFINPVTKGVDLSPEAAQRAWEKLIELPFTNSIVRHSGFDAKVVSKDYISEYLDGLKLLGPKLFFKLFSQLSTYHTQEWIQNAHAPVLSIMGEQDTVTPTWTQFPLPRKDANWSWAMIPSAGHVPQIDRADWCNRLILSFLDQKKATHRVA